MTRPKTCGHCGQPQRGHASANDTPLCHPDDGLDCYHLVTVYRHPMPCDCADVEATFPVQAEAWDLMDRDHDAAIALYQANMARQSDAEAR